MKLPYLPSLALIAVALAGCGTSPPLRYYALEAVAPAGSAVRPLGVALIHVRHISVPAEMDHRGLTHHQGPNQVAISDNDQWSAPLTDLIQGTITRDLGERLGFDHVLAPDAQPVAPHPDVEKRGTRGTTQAQLDLDFVALTADDSCGVTAQVNWTLSVTDGAARRGTAHLSGAGASCPAGLPAALSAALGTLADQLAAQFTSP